MATIRKDKLETDEIYHIFSRSIAEYKIFNNRAEYFRMFNGLQFYQFNNMPMRLARFIETLKTEKQGFRNRLLEIVDEKDKIVEIIAYCFMPTHIHLILKQLADNGITIFMRNALNSYSHYFNLKHNRLGPLWQSEFKNVLVSSDNQLLHLTRYIHLNPATAYLVDKPKDWEFSSYKEYIGEAKEKICEFDNLMDINPKEYREFINNRISYQRELKKIKDLLVDENIIIT
ncbi:MAG: transposase [Patescibacteria group bacterium]